MASTISPLIILRLLESMNACRSSIVLNIAALAIFVVGESGKSGVAVTIYEIQIRVAFILNLLNFELRYVLFLTMLVRLFDYHTTPF